MLTAARLEALRLIAAERILNDRQLLDRVASPLRLTEVPDPDEDRLRNILSVIVDEIPLSVRPEFIEVPRSNGTFGLVAPAVGLVLAAQELRSPSGDPWVCAAPFLMHPLGGEIDDEPGVSSSSSVELDALINRLNWNDHACTWGLWKGDGADSARSIVRISGSAVPFGPRMAAWCRLVAVLCQEALHFGERTSEVGSGPVDRHLKVLAIDAAGAYTPEAVQAAAEAFQAAVDPALRKVVWVTPTSSGAMVTVPFHADGQVYPIRVVFAVTAPDAERSGLNIYAPLFKPLPTKHVTGWLRSLNGTDESAPDDGVWVNTTPWQLGSWVMFDPVGEKTGVLYRGHIPHYMAENSDLTEIVQGTIREVWSSCNKYRLHEEFEQTIGGLDGAFEKR